MSEEGVGGGFMPEVESIIGALERGTVVTKFFFRKRPERRTLSIRRETRDIIWQRTATRRNASDGTGTPHPQLLVPLVPEDSESCLLSIFQLVMPWESATIYLRLVTTH